MRFIPTLFTLTTIMTFLSLPALGYEGVVKADQTCVLTAEQRGIIQFMVTPGSILNQYKPIASISDPSVEIELESTLQDYKQALAQLDTDEQLHQSGSLSDSALEQTRSALAIAQLKFFQLAPKFSDLRTLDLKGRIQKIRDLKIADLVPALVRMPVNGVIQELLIDGFNTVNKGDKIARIMNLDTVRVDIFPPISQLRRFTPGTPVTVATAGALIPAKVLFVSPEINTTTSTFKATIGIPNIKSDASTSLVWRYWLLPGQIVNVK